MTADVARQSCELLLDPRTGFFPDVALDPRGVAAVLDLRSRLADPPRPLTDPDRYLDRRYWRQAMGGR
jgi:hypothetical protein